MLDMLTKGHCKQIVALHFWFGVKIYHSLEVLFWMIDRPTN